MACLRCNYDFCWSCMSKEDSCVLCNAIPICPRLPYSMCTNLMITLVSFILAPIVLTLGPLLVGLIFGMIVVPQQIYAKKKYDCCGYQRNCLKQASLILLCILVSWVFILPLILSLAILVSGLAGSIGTIVFWILCLVYVFRLTSNTIRGMCKVRR